MLTALQLVINVWTLFVASSCVGEAHRFSSAKGFLTLVISAALPLIVIVGAVYTFKT